MSGFVLSKREYYHIGCQHCKGGFFLYEPPPEMLHCPFCGVYLKTGGDGEWLRSAVQEKVRVEQRKSSKHGILEVSYAIQEQSTDEKIL